MAGFWPPGSPLFLGLYTHVEIWIDLVTMSARSMGSLMTLLMLVLILTMALTRVSRMVEMLAKMKVSMKFLVEMEDNPYVEKLVGKVWHWD